MFNHGSYVSILNELESRHAALVAVSKTKPVEAIMEVYNSGQRLFGENYVQEMVEKSSQLPADIQWHFIGHLQTNKVRLIAPFVAMIQSVDSLKLLQEINKEGKKNNRVIQCLLQVYIAEEETKSGFTFGDLEKLLSSSVIQNYPNVRVAGLMGMATLTDDADQIRNEFHALKNLFVKNPSLRILSMGMTSDYKIALEEGSNMVRIGSAIFGERT